MPHEHALLVADETNRAEQDKHCGNQEQANFLFDPGKAPGRGVFVLHCVLLGGFGRSEQLRVHRRYRAFSLLVVDWRVYRNRGIQCALPAHMCNRYQSPSTSSNCTKVPPGCLAWYVSAKYG